MATIVKRPGPRGTRYQVRIRLGQVERSGTFATLAHAREWATLLEGELRLLRYAPHRAGRQTLGELLVRYEQDIVPLKPRETARVYARHLVWWAQELGACRLADLTPARLHAARDRLAVGRAPATVNHYLATVSHVLTLGVEWGWLHDSPMRQVRRLRTPRGRVRWLAEEERRRLLATCAQSHNGLLYPIVVLALSTGARKMELMRLTWRDVDLPGGRLTLRVSKSRTQHVLPLVGHAHAQVTLLAKVRRLDTTLLFPRADGRQPVDIRYAWQLALQGAGITDFRFHDLRHSAASYLAMIGASQAVIARVLAHSAPQTADRYTHTFDAHVAALVAQMNTAIFG